MRRLILCCALLFSAGVGQGQTDVTTPGPEGAEAAVRAYLDAFAESDWEAAGSLIDPAELAVMSDLVEFIAEMDTTEATQSLRGETDEVLIFARFMDLMTNMEPMMGESLASMRTEILGHVAEGDSLVHVVGRSRTEMFGAEVESVQVTSVRWLGARWALQLDAQLEGMTEGLRQFSEIMGSFEEEDGEPIFQEDWDEDGNEEDGSDG
ncbi:MAG: hypothetical protein AAF170_05270 [Bacteroidota bacterium]